MTEIHSLLPPCGHEEPYHLFRRVLYYPFEPETEGHLQLRILLSDGVDVKVDGNCELAEGVEVGYL